MSIYYNIETPTNHTACLWIVVGIHTDTRKTSKLRTGMLKHSRVLNLGLSCSEAENLDKCM